MESSPKIFSLIVGCLVFLCGVYYSMGVFFENFRGRWGRQKQGEKMSRVSQTLWALNFLLLGAGAVLSAFHITSVNGILLFVIVPCFVGLFFMGWYDNRDKGRDAV